MTHQEENKLIQKFKSAKAAYDKEYAPSADAVEKSRAQVMAYVMAHGGQSSRILSFTEKLKVNINFLRYFVPPKFVYSMAAFAVLIVSATVAMASQGALPGEAFYSAKLAVDEVKVRFTSNPAARAQVQMEIAGHRLREIQEISQTGDDYNGRLNETLSRFAKDVGEAQKNLAQAGDPAQVKAATTQIAKKAQEYSKELTATQVLLEQKAATVQQQSEQSDDLLAQAGGEGSLENLEQIGETESTVSKKPARLVEFSAFTQAQQALEAVVREDQEEAITEVVNEDDGNSEDEAEKVEEGEPLENGEVGL